MINNNQNIPPANYSPPPARPKTDPDSEIRQRFMNEEMGNFAKKLGNKEVVALRNQKLGTLTLVSKVGVKVFSLKEGEEKIKTDSLRVVNKDKWVTTAKAITEERLDAYHDIQRTMVEVTRILGKDKRDNLLLFIEGRDGLRRKVTKEKGIVRYEIIDRDASQILAVANKAFTHITGLAKDDILLEAMENKRKLEGK